MEDNGFRPTEEGVPHCLERYNGLLHINIKLLHGPKILINYGIL